MPKKPKPKGDKKPGKKSPDTARWSNARGGKC